MGVTVDLDYARTLPVPKRLSLLLHRSGISTPEEVRRYLDFAKHFAEGVVVRQMFEYEYPDALKHEVVSSKELLGELKIGKYTLNNQGNPVFSYECMNVEIELRSCACESHNPVLHADGLLYKGWSKEPLT